MPREVRTVTLCEVEEAKPGMEGGSPRLWAFGYKTLAQILGVKEGTVRMAVHQGRLDPADLEMVCESWLRYNPSKAITLAAQLTTPLGFDTSPEERAMIADMRSKAIEQMPTTSPEEEAERMVERCKDAPVPSGPTPVELLDHHGKLEREIIGDLNAKCAAGVQQNSMGEAKCGACGLAVDVHTLDGLSACMEKLKAVRRTKSEEAKEEWPTPGWAKPNDHDPDVPF